MKEHHYRITNTWTGNLGKGTKNYRAYSRDHILSAEGKKHDIESSSDPSFRGDPARYNPEELFLASLSACHMLWFLHLCATHKITVIEYTDRAEGLMEEAGDGSGKFTSVTLRPEVCILEAEKAGEVPQLHAEANRMCFIANSCNFPIGHQGKTLVKE